jgi:hypothetical protein
MANETNVQARARAAKKPAGKLAATLQAQKAQTRTDTLKDLSKENRGHRDADEAAATRSYN